MRPAEEGANSPGQVAPVTPPSTGAGSGPGRWVLLADLSQARPATALSPQPGPGQWTVVPYRTAEGPGAMLLSGPESQAPPVRLALPVTGWYHVFVATWRSPQAGDGCLLLKLASDRAYRRAATESFRPEKDLVVPEMLPSTTELAEAYWRTVHLDPGEELVLSRPAGGTMAETVACIAYVRLVPATDDEVAAWGPVGHGPVTRRLLANYDGGQHLMWAYANQGEMQDEFEALRDSDFAAVLWGAAYSLATFYPSTVGSPVCWAPGFAGIAQAGRQAEARRQRAGFDPLAAAVACAHDAGLSLYPQVRMEGEQWPPYHRAYGGPGQFQRLHPEWRCRTASGGAARHLSQAYPQVRAAYVSLFREWVEQYQADGVCIVFCRSWPYVLYEEPVVQSFLSEHGMDPRRLDRFDLRVLEHQSRFVTGLLRQTRAMLDQVGQAQGRRLSACYVVPGDTALPANCPDLGAFGPPLAHGLDVGAWVREGLVDHLVVHLERVGAADGSDSAPVVQAYADLVCGRATRLYADLYPRRQSARSMLVRAQSCYRAGADGLCFWDCQDRATRLSGWAMHRRLGHPDPLAAYARFADQLFRRVPLQELDGFDLNDPDCLPTDG